MRVSVYKNYYFMHSCTFLQEGGGQLVPGLLALCYRTAATPPQDCVQSIIMADAAPGVCFQIDSHLIFTDELAVYSALGSRCECWSEASTSETHGDTELTESSVSGVLMLGSYINNI